MEINPKWRRYLVVGLAVVAVVFAFSWKVGDGWYYHNDGVTLACSLEPITELIHPGSWETRGCSYDHQPLYLLLVKATGPLFNYELWAYQLLNVLFYFLAWGLLSRRLSRRHDFYLSLAVPFFFMSSFSVLYWIQELRMYALYLLTCSVLMLNVEELDEPRKNNWSILNHVVGYFNFIMYLFPFLPYWIVRLRKTSDRRFRAFSVILIILVLIKVPYVLWWRVKMRSGGIVASVDSVWGQFGLRLFEGTNIYVSTGWILAIFGVVWAIWKDRRSVQTRIYLYLVLSTVLFVLVCILGLKMHEIELRYFLFLTPLLAIITVKAISRIGSRPLKKFIAFCLFGVAFHNSLQMYTRGHQEGGEIKKAALVLKEASQKSQEVWIDDRYWYKNYLGIYAQVLGGRPMRIREFERGASLPTQNFVLATVIKTPEEHFEMAKEFPVELKTVWAEKNMLEARTIISVPVTGK